MIAQISTSRATGHDLSKGLRNVCVCVLTCVHMYNIIYVDVQTIYVYMVQR